MKRIIGIDPGLNNTGYGVIDFLPNNSYKLVASGTIKTTTKDSLADRLLIIHNELSVILTEYAPHTGAIEDTYVNTNAASSLKLAHARSASMLTIKIYGIDIGNYQSKTIKKAVCGNGSADKTQMIAMVNFLMPAAKITNPDAADAIATAICHGFYHKSKLQA